jgi:hypothetical protein
MLNTKRWIFAAALSAVFLFAGSFARSGNDDSPQVGNFTSSSQETNFMSLPSYQTISSGDTVRIIQQQDIAVNIGQGENSHENAKGSL